MKELLWKLIIILGFLGMVTPAPVISAGITFGAPIYRPPIYYEQPYGHYHHYHEVPTRYSYGYQNGYDYYGGGGGYYGSLNLSPYLF